MTCDLAQLDGAYVLGALAPTERQEYERHLAGCHPCSRSVRELAGLPGLLGRLDASALDDEPLAPLPDTLLPALLRETRLAERRRLLLATGLAAAAAVVAGVLVTYAVLGGASPTPQADPGPGASAGPSAGSSPIASASPAALAMAAVGRAPVAGRLLVEDVAWGTRLGLTCTYSGAAADAAGATYLLVVRFTDGRTEQVGTWQALSGRTMQVTGATAARRGDIAAIEVRLASGMTVLTLRI
ncbi:MAG: zf-HC2 domain-containing protein [Nocardioides sp.]